MKPIVHNYNVDASKTVYIHIQDIIHEAPIQSKSHKGSQVLISSMFMSHSPSFPPSSI